MNRRGRSLKTRAGPEREGGPRRLCGEDYSAPDARAGEMREEAAMLSAVPSLSAVRQLRAAVLYLRERLRVALVRPRALAPRLAASVTLAGVVAGAVAAFVLAPRPTTAARTM